MSAESVLHLASVAPSGAAGAVSPSSVAAFAPAAPVADVEVPTSWLPGGSREEPDPANSFLMEAERMRVYQLALELQCHANTLVPSVNRVLRDQFERASLSVVLNSAEAFGRFSRRQKRYHVGVARGSAMECAAICDVLRVRRLAPDVECNRAKRLAVRCVQMLSKLEQALSRPTKDEAAEAAA